MGVVIHISFQREPYIEHESILDSERLIILQTEAVIAQGGEVGKYPL